MAEVRITRERTSEGPSVKTTTYETRTSYESETTSPVYKATMTPRHLIIQRSGYSGGAGGSSRSFERSSHYGNVGAPAGAYALVTQTGVTAVKTSREKEKKDMQDLNERFASYIEKVDHRSLPVNSYRQAACSRTLVESSTNLNLSLPVSLPDWPPQGSWLGHWSSSDFNVQKGTHPSDLSASVVLP